MISPDNAFPPRQRKQATYLGDGCTSTTRLSGMHALAGNPGASFGRGGILCSCPERMERIVGLTFTSREDKVIKYEREREGWSHKAIMHGE